MKPQRWTASPSRAPGPDRDDEARAGRLLRAAVVEEPLDAGALADIRSRLPDGRAPRRLALRVAVAVALFLSGSGVSAALLGHWSVFRRTPAPPTVTTRPVAATPRQKRAAAAPAAVADPEPVAAPPVAEVVPRTRTVRRADVAVIGPAHPLDVAPPAPAPSAIAEEAALLGAALRTLREGGDAAAALALLDERDARFGAGGALADEASTTRVEALLRLGQHARALALLDARVAPPTGRSRELLATRAELRADAGRCPEAITDFDALLAGDGTGDLVAERALYGRAACRARGGDTDAARTDLEAYVARFPAGRFTSRARAALDR